jgi:hypothetical protein
MQHTRDHWVSISLMVLLFVAALFVWIAVQSTREEPLPTLVWAPKVTDHQVIESSSRVLDRLNWPVGPWWWVYATPGEREILKEKGAVIAVAMPTPLAQMAGCSLPF